MVHPSGTATVNPVGSVYGCQPLGSPLALDGAATLATDDTVEAGAVGDGTVEADGSEARPPVGATGGVARGVCRVARYRPVPTARATTSAMPRRPNRTPRRSGRNRDGSTGGGGSSTVGVGSVGASTD